MHYDLDYYAAKAHRQCRNCVVFFVCFFCFLFWNVQFATEVLQLTADAA